MSRNFSKSEKILDMMRAGNISRQHIGLEPLPYLWYKNLYRMKCEKTIKFLEPRDGNIIMEYCKASRKKRRETQAMRECYLMVHRILKQKARLEEQDKIIEKLNKQIQKTRKK